jgi:hypothetical protein
MKSRTTFAEATVVKKAGSPTLKLVPPLSPSPKASAAGESFSDTRTEVEKAGRIVGAGVSGLGGLGECENRKEA